MIEYFTKDLRPYPWEPLPKLLLNDETLFSLGYEFIGFYLYATGRTRAENETRIEKYLSTFKGKYPKGLIAKMRKVKMELVKHHW